MTPEEITEVWRMLREQEAYTTELVQLRKMKATAEAWADMEYASIDSQDPGGPQVARNILAGKEPMKGRQ